MRARKPAKRTARSQGWAQFDVDSGLPREARTLGFAKDKLALRAIRDANREPQGLHPHPVSPSVYAFQMPRAAAQVSSELP